MMSEVHMSNSAGTIVLRVRAEDAQPRSNAFDALILSTDRAVHEDVTPSRLTAVAVPFERELPGENLTLIVRGNDAALSLVSECDVLGSDGRRRVYGRSAK